MATLLSTLVDTSIGAVVLFGRRPHRSPDESPVPSITVARFSVALGATAVCFAAKLVAWRAVGLNAFGLMRLVYFDLVIGLPLLGIAVLFASRTRRVVVPVRVAAFMACAMIPIGVYASFVEPFRLRFERHTVPVRAERAGRSPLRIGVLADIQTDRVTDFERSAVDRLMAERPDLILLPGDLHQGTHQELALQSPAFRDLLARVSAPGGVYFVSGNVDDEARLGPVFAGTGIRWLSNEIARVSVRDWRIRLTGLELNAQSRAAAEAVRELESADGNELRILVAHYPDAVFQQRLNSRIDLLIAGHTHGGQVVIPGFGPPITLTGVPRRVAAGGLHELDGRRLYVSRGLGHERGQAPRIRFFCPPEITLLTLQSDTE